MGVHLRLAAAVVRLMQSHQAHVVLKSGSVVSNARSMMGILTLGAAQGRTITVVADGEDEEVALEKIGRILEDPRP